MCHRAWDPAPLWEGGFRKGVISFIVVVVSVGVAGGERSAKRCEGGPAVFLELGLLVCVSKAKASGCFVEGKGLGSVDKDDEQPV